MLEGSQRKSDVALRVQADRQLGWPRDARRKQDGRLLRSDASKRTLRKDVTMVPPPNDMEFSGERSESAATTG